MFIEIFVKEKKRKKKNLKRFVNTKILIKEGKVKTNMKKIV